MKYHNLICDTCGFKTQEPIGVYQCPTCGSTMRFSKKASESIGYQREGQLIIYGVPLGLLLLVPVVGIILYPAVMILIWQALKKSQRNNAIRLHSTQILNKSWVLYTCNTCGGQFKGQRGNCPHCGAMLSYND